jgi:uncharacterized protein
MELEQSFTVAQPPGAVWTAFKDVALVASCIPGASLTEPPDGGRFKGQIGVKLGPIAASFGGDGEATWDDAAKSGTVSGKGTDRKSASRVQAQLSYRLTGEGEGTRIELSVDYTLSGSLAQFGRGQIVADVAGRITSEFARNLEARLEAASAPAARSAAAPPSGMAPSTPPAAPLDAGGLLWSVLRARIAAFFRRLLG